MAMKDSGVDWIGTIPEDWECEPLRYIAQHNSDTSQFKPDKPYIALENVEPWTGKLIFNCEIEVVESTVSNFRSADVLFGKLRPYLAKVVAPKHEGQASTELIAISPIKYTTRFLFWALINKGFIDHINVLTYGVKMPRTGWEQMKQQYFPLPSQSEQIQITDYLDESTANIDKMLELLSQQIDTLERYKKSVIHEAVTKGLKPDTQMKNSGVDWIGTIPEDWEKSRLSWVFSEIGSGTTPDSSNYDYYDGDISWIQSGDLGSSHLGATEKTVTDSALRNHSALKIYKAPFIVIAMYGASIGNSSVSDIDACTNQACCVLLRPDGVLDYFAYVVKDMKESMVTEGRGGTQPNISQVMIKHFWTPLPPKTEQQQIADYLDNRCAKIDAILDIKRKQVEVLKKRRQSLIYEYVTGKRRVEG